MSFLSKIIECDIIVPMNFKQLNRKFLIKVLAITFGWLFFVLVVLSSQIYRNVNNGVYSFTNQFKNFFVTNPLQNIFDFFGDFTKMRNVYQENESLRRSLTEVEQLQARVIELQQDNLRLQHQLEIGSTYAQLTVIPARTLEKKVALNNHTLLINQGEDDGVSLHMAVIDQHGLIGKITEVGKDFSIVSLLTDPLSTNQFGVKIQLEDNKTIEAILVSYQASSNKYEVKLLEPSTQVKIDDKVITSGLGEIIPSGILIGKVSKVEESLSSKSVTILVDPITDFNHLEYVSVLSK